MNGDFCIYKIIVHLYLPKDSSTVCFSPGRITDTLNWEEWSLVRNQFFYYSCNRTTLISVQITFPSSLSDYHNIMEEELEVGWVGRKMMLRILRRKEYIYYRVNKSIHTFFIEYIPCLLYEFIKDMTLLYDSPKLVRCDFFCRNLHFFFSLRKCELC